MIQSELREWLTYNPDTGIFVSNKTGKSVGSLSLEGYIIISFKGKPCKAHRAAMIYMGFDIPDDYIVDHIDGDKTNNRFSNLRIATRAQNSYNRKLNKNNRSGIKGIHWDSSHGRWGAAISINNKKTFLGLFTDIDTAREAIEKARQELHGEFARNF